mmetsp:Transcript_42475/g.121505  ORF Transcript_42475/g.121505 Transcript_42475/m.121505 type:complete len:241 (+) Transcript_42475:939-1661(+)
MSPQNISPSQYSGLAPLRRSMSTMANPASPSVAHTCSATCSGRSPQHWSSMSRVPKVSKNSKAFKFCRLTASCTQCGRVQECEQVNANCSRDAEPCARAASMSSSTVQRRNSGPDGGVVRLRLVGSGVPTMFQPPFLILERGAGESAEFTCEIGENVDSAGCWIGVHSPDPGSTVGSGQRRGGDQPTGCTGRAWGVLGGGIMTPCCWVAASSCVGRRNGDNGRAPGGNISEDSSSDIASV